ncbi:hypothetical protein CHUAL_008400 [Chamberlinius hualienensis]
MKLQRSNKLLSVAICLLAVVYSASSQPCCYTATDCSWTGIWLSYPVYTPILTDYPYFLSTAPSSYFKFIQDQSGTEVSETIFLISEPDTVISFDYFLDSPYTSSNNFLEVYFENVNTGFKTLIDARLTPNPTWNRGYTITCDSTVSFCCGAKDLPCNGRISVSANIDASYRQALFAFDRIGVCGVTPITNCCNFDVDNCATSTNWIWSANATPIPPIPYPPPSGGGYIWTQTGGAQALFPLVNVPNIGAYFSFYYYIESSAADIQVAFYPTGGSPVIVTILSYTTSYTWLYTGSLACNNCCGGPGSCDGRLGITAVETGGTIVAVDEVLFNGGCF